MEQQQQQPSIWTSSPIPSDMLSSPCAVRISYRISFLSQEIVPIEDFRYSEWEAKIHHDHTGHSLELFTNRVSPCVVHTLIRSCPDGKLVELSAHCRHGANKRFCNCTKDYTFINAIMDSRIAVHKRFGEERMERLPKPFEETKPTFTEAEQQAIFDRLRRTYEAKKREAREAADEHLAAV